MMDRNHQELKCFIIILHNVLIVFSSLNSKLEFICIEVEPTQKIFPTRRCSKAPNSSKKREKPIVVLVTREAEAQAIMQMDHGKMKK